jgi:hypothetical protein
MAVVTVKSGVITNRDASPRVINNPGAAAGTLRGFVGAVLTTTGDSIASKYIFGQVPSNAVLRHVALTADDMGANTLADFGVYETTANGGAAVAASLFAAARTLKDGAVSGVELLNANTITIANSEKRLWELLGLSSDPGKNYDIAAALTVACDAGGNMLLRVTYAV